MKFGYDEDDDTLVKMSSTFQFMGISWRNFSDIKHTHNIIAVAAHKNSGSDFSFVFMHNHKSLSLSPHAQHVFAKWKENEIELKVSFHSKRVQHRIKIKINCCYLWIRVVPIR